MATIREEHEWLMNLYGVGVGLGTWAEVEGMEGFRERMLEVSGEVLRLYGELRGDWFVPRAREQWEKCGVVGDGSWQDLAIE